MIATYQVTSYMVSIPGNYPGYILEVIMFGRHGINIGLWIALAIALMQQPAEASAKEKFRKAGRATAKAALIVPLSTIRVTSYGLAISILMLERLDNGIEKLGSWLDREEPSPIIEKRKA